VEFDTVPNILDSCMYFESIVHGDLSDINKHIDSCLQRSEFPQTNNGSPKKKSKTKSKAKSTEVEESDISNELEEDLGPNVEIYTWGEETRIRACTLENGYQGVNGERLKKKEQDIDGELDITEDLDSKFGQAQYSESDLILQKDEDKENKILRRRVSSQSVTQRPQSNHVYSNTLSNNVNNVTDGKSEVTSDSDSLSYPISSSSVEGTSAAMIIEALKEKIKHQERLIQSTYSCLICLEQYQIPLVSINCWHVHCERCWRSALGAMKLCPQCKVITSPTDLRKIYL